MKQSKAQLLKLPRVDYWRYRTTDGEVSIYMPRGGKLTVERANILLDYAKKELINWVDD